MTHQRITLHRYRQWRVVVFYESRKDDAPAILRELELAGADTATLRQARANLHGGLPDTGLTFTNPEQRRTIIVLGHTTSRAEFANTWLHETLHAATHIAAAIGYDLQGEATAYIGGNLAKEMQPEAARLMCPDCHE